MLSIYATVNKKLSPRHPLPPPDYKFIQTTTTKFDGSKFFMNGHEIFKLEREIIYCMNNRDLLRCFATTQGTLCIFKMPAEDVIYLNSLLYQLVLLKNIQVGHVHYLRQPTKNSAAEHVHYDRNTRVFNRVGIELWKSDFISCFHGRVALAVKGVRVIDDYHIYPEMFVYQVKIEEEEDTTFDRSADCIFD
jgi:hypothetical protein